MTSLLFLTTRDSETASNYDTFWNINYPRLNTLHRYKVSLQSIEFANSVYPINNNNNVIRVDEDAGSQTSSVTLTNQGYTGTELATELQTKLNADATLAGTYAVSYSTQTKLLTIGVSGGAAAFSFETVANDAYDDLGFNRSSFAAEAASQTSDFPINISGTQYVDVVTNLTTHNHSNSSTAKVLDRVPLEVPFGSIVFYQPEYEQDLYVTTDQIDQIDLRLVDDRGNLFELPANCYVSLTLRIE